MVRPDYSNVGISMTSSTAIAFNFVVDLGTLHQVCVVDFATLPGNGPTTPQQQRRTTAAGNRQCFNLAGISSSNMMKTVNGEVAQADVTNEYIIRPATEAPSLLGRKIEYIMFRQEGRSTTRSRFSNIESYDMVSFFYKQCITYF